MRNSVGQGLMFKEQPWILVVDDEPLILNLITDILSTEGYQVETADDGKQALRALQDHPFDLVLTDMMMPDMSGLELVQYLRVHHAGTLAIVFTGFANYQDAVEAVKLGAFDYLPKPVQPEILRHAIRKALEYQRLSKAQKDLETVFQGAEALGWQAAELISTPQEAEILSSLREWSLEQEGLQEVGRQFLSAARDLVQSTNSSIFLFDGVQGEFFGLAAAGPEAEIKEAVRGGVRGIMGFVAGHPRPLLVSDLNRDQQFALMARRVPYRTDSFMIIPLTGYKFWGVINLADRQDGKPFEARDLFLGWLLGRLLVEILETRTPVECEVADLPLEAPWIGEELPMGVAFLDENLTILQSNPALIHLTGHEDETLAGCAILPLLGLSSQDREKLETAFRQALTTRESQEIVAIKTVPQENAVRYLGFRVVPLPAGQGGARGLLLVDDVTEMETLKQRLHLYEHLAVLGKLTLCVVHELNNPLDGIRRYLSLALKKKEDPGEVGRYLGEVQKGLQKMSMSIKSLMFSANPQQAPPRASDTLNNLLHDAIKIMMLQASDQRVKVGFYPPAEFGKLTVEADLYYVFINIIKNALQAMPHGGKLQVHGILEDRRVEISFEDSGPGLSPEEQDKIFEPFYSTKQGIQGLGLGLPICQKILDRYGGRLVVESNPGQGTKMRIILPHAESGGSDGQ
jgi:PAS domain S-box-containing protein